MRRRRGNGLGLDLGEIFRAVIDILQPITLMTVLVMVTCYIQPSLLLRRSSWPGIDRVCISVENIVKYREWNRLILSAVFHANERHLYYNMISFVWTSRQLERKFSSNIYLILLIFLTLSTNLVYILINTLLAEYVDYRYCTVGFSGVLFALKMILDSFSPNTYTSVMGLFVVPIHYASWLELILISVLVPNASFVGHLSGILVGILSVWLYNTFGRRRNYFHGSPQRLGDQSDEDLRRALAESRRVNSELRQRTEDQETRIDSLGELNWVIIYVRFYNIVKRPLAATNGPFIWKKSTVETVYFLTIP